MDHADEQGLYDTTYPVTLVSPTFTVEIDKTPRAGSVRSGHFGTGYAKW